MGRDWVTMVRTVDLAEEPRMRRVLVPVLSAALGAAPFLPLAAAAQPAPDGRPSITRPGPGVAAGTVTTASTLAARAGRELTGRVLFDADVADKGLAAYGSVHNGHRIRVVDDPGPLGSARKVLRFEVHESDDQLTGDPRAQAETPRMFHEGEEIWVGFSTYFPSAWPDRIPAGPGNFVTFAEVYGPPYQGSAPVKLSMRAGREALTFQRNATYDWDIPWEQGPIEKNVWHDWVIREKLSSDGQVGFVEIYRNTGAGWAPMPLFGKTRLYTQTIDASNAQGPQYHKLALYYAADMGLPSPLVMYFADHKVATSFLAAAPRSHRLQLPDAAR